MMSNRAMDADFAVIPIRAAVPRPAREVWDLIGGFFDLDKWLDVECAPVAGSGETGSIRIINGAVVEPLIGATSLSYTYAQTEGPMAALGYHGTLACEPADEGSSMIVYTLAYDQSALDPDERAASRARIESRFGGAVEAMRQFCLPN